MLIFPRRRPSPVDEAVHGRVAADVTAALEAIRTEGGRFVVNDSRWFQQRPNGKVTPYVMNAADFLSKTFQDHLHVTRGWAKEQTVRGQTIDAYLELDVAGPWHRVPADRFLEFFVQVDEPAAGEELRTRFLRLWHDCVRVGVRDRETFGPRFRAFFTDVVPTRRLRIGLEFETGNIASAFRSLDKLETLFVLDEIDYGVFVTSNDKPNAATRIWPASNRNGSFEELENRNYRGNRSVPLWEFGFAPDAFSPSAPYLAKDGTTWAPTPTGRTKRIGGVEYEVWKRGRGEQILRPAPAQSAST